MRMRTHRVVDEVDAAEVVEQVTDAAEVVEQVADAAEVAMKFQPKIACTDKTKQLKATTTTHSTSLIT
jgi:hypothetical protein